MKEHSLVSGTPLSMYISSDPSLFGVGFFIISLVDCITAYQTFWFPSL